MTTNATDDTNDIILQTYTARTKIHEEASEIIQELTTPPVAGGRPIGIDDPLIDKDGYPRGDVDVARARQLRYRLAVLKTDYKELSKTIETAVLNGADNIPIEKHAEQECKTKPMYDSKLEKWVIPTTAPNSTTIATNHTISSSSTSHPEPTVQFIHNGVPFAIIDEIANNSPASKAGLKLHDLILQFGSVHTTAEFQTIAELVANAYQQKKEIKVVVLRTGQDGTNTTLEVNVYPAPWEGRGLLGCHIQKHVVEERRRDPPPEYQKKHG